MDEPDDLPAAQTTKREEGSKNYRREHGARDRLFCGVMLGEMHQDAIEAEEQRVPRPDVDDLSAVHGKRAAEIGKEHVLPVSHAGKRHNSQLACGTSDHAIKFVRAEGDGVIDAGIVIAG
jgi:hypothetical protein